VLKRRHRAGVDVDVWIELYEGDLRPRDSTIAASEAAAMPLPREDTTPPVTKTYFVMFEEARDAVRDGVTGKAEYTDARCSY